MNIDGLKALWKEAFSDSDGFIDGFFRTGFDPQKCCVLEANGQLQAALYWFDCFREKDKFAYLYAVAVAKAHRGKGLSRVLLKKTHSVLSKLGYAGAVLCPASEGLFSLYGQEGYQTFCHMDTFTCQPDMPIPLEELTPGQYTLARQTYLPEGGLLQEGTEYLHTWCRFFRGNGFLICGYMEKDILQVRELLGDRAQAPGIVAALGAKKGVFHTPGTQIPFAMYYPLSTVPVPTYLGLSFD